MAEIRINKIIPAVDRIRSPFFKKAIRLMADRFDKEFISQSGLIFQGKDPGLEWPAATSNISTSCTGDTLTKEVLQNSLDLLRNMPPVPKIPPFVLRRLPWPLKQARTHKRKRINKKWRKRYGMVPDTSFDDGMVYVIKASPYGGCSDFILMTTAVDIYSAYPNTYARLEKALSEVQHG